MTSLARFFLFACYFFGLLLVTWLNHPKEYFYTWVGIVWADASGYFIYLPATFYYSWNAALVPPESVELFGEGFFLQEDGVISTKYTYGVSLLLSPFYTICDLVWRLGTDATAMPGMSITHQRAVLIGGVFYATVGCYMLSSWLQRYSEPMAAIIWTIILFSGSNLLFYSIESMGMSHVYSFALFSALMLLVQRLGDQGGIKPLANGWWLLLGAMLGLTVVIRPTNIMFFLPLGWLHKKEIELIWRRLNTKGLAIAFLLLLSGCFLVVFPQLMYWKYAFGHLISYSYTGEYFTWSNPALLYFWFAVSGGMLWYIPILWLALPAWWYWWQRDPKEAGILFIFYFSVSYVNSCWWSWNFGGSYGARAMAEYSVLLSLPIVKLYPRFIPKLGGYKKLLWWILLLIIIIYSLKLTYSFKRYWWGANEWDIAYLVKLIFK